MLLILSLAASLTLVRPLVAVLRYGHDQAQPQMRRPFRQMRVLVYGAIALNAGLLFAVVDGYPASWPKGWALFAIIAVCLAVHGRLHQFHRTGVQAVSIPLYIYRT